MNIKPMKYSCIYYRFRIPVIGRFGINSGLMFMKLDELRRFDFVNKIIEIKNKTKYRIYGDQDMINFLFHNQTGKIKFLNFGINLIIFTQAIIL